MLDFYEIEKIPNYKKGTLEICPKFLVNFKTQDLMIRGGDFYAVWNPDEHLWSTDEGTVIDLIDDDIRKVCQEEKDKQGGTSGLGGLSIIPHYMVDADSGSIDKWHKYVQKQLRDINKPMDTKIIFANTKSTKRDYASKRLDYDICEMPIPNYTELMQTLYEPDERDKLEWAIGAIISGDSKSIQKFIVLYGDAGSGKSTFLKIVEQLFGPYLSTFDAKEMGSMNNQFALNFMKNNPLVSIQHDGDLSRIEDNTVLNSVISHEPMEVNPKYGRRYEVVPRTFLFMGTNKPVRITDSRSGMMRRLIDVKPSGQKIKPYSRYKKIMEGISSELGGIAWHCLNKYNSLGESYYDSYQPFDMFRMTNDFYDFMQEYYDDFARHQYVDLTTVWDLYGKYCEQANVKNKMQRRTVANELKGYFKDYKAETVIEGKHKRNVYYGFKSERFEYISSKQDLVAIPKQHPLGQFEQQMSIFDITYSEQPAQYAKEDGTPSISWAKCTRKLYELMTNKLHYVKVPENHIVIDFDRKGPDGNKDLNENLEAVKRFLDETGLPPTYAELSKSGAGIHLHYIYDGDASKLSRVYDDNIEVKVFTGNASLRRQLTKCNTMQIKHIKSGLPLKGEPKVIGETVLSNEKALISFIKNCLAKKHHGATTPEISFLKSELDKLYSDKSIHYDVTAMRPAVLAFAMNSTHQKDKCVDMVNQMHFASEEPSEFQDSEKSDIVFYDVEVFPNLFVVCYKFKGKDAVVKMINPTAMEITDLLKYRLIGFNNRRYDNHILYGRVVGFDNYQLYTLSQRIIAGSKNAMFKEAYNLSYTDIFDFCATKQSLKKWEIQLGIHHLELGLRWDQEVPEELYSKVADYCANDVIATEAVFEANKGDFLAREILADLAGGSVNDTTNSLTTKIIFGNDKHPELVYTDLSIEFPGYEYVNGHNMYHGIDVGKGGYVYADPGMYIGDIVTYDSISHHPHSFIALNYAGKYTDRFEMLLKTRAYIKHKDFESARKMFDGRLEPWLKDESMAKSLSKALKIAINSVYGLSSATFDNPFRDPRNSNNIVALRGALFMVNLKEEVEKKGFKVIHIKTDSIKILNPTPELANYINEYAAKYGYEFEIEHKFSRICLVNDAVFIAKLSDDDPEDPGKWTATGTQFQQPYVFKTLFSHEPIEFEDMCETKSVKTALYLDMNEDRGGLTPEEVKEYNTLIKYYGNDRTREDDEKLLEKIKKTYGYISIDQINNRIDELDKREEKSHDYHFVGKVGQFCPIKPGCGGGLLVRENEGSGYSSATGAKGYRWLESETVRLLNKQDDIDRSYYIKQVDKAVSDISLFGDFEAFVSDKPKEPNWVDITSDDLPF